MKRNVKKKKKKDYYLCCQIFFYAPHISYSHFLSLSFFLSFCFLTIACPLKENYLVFFFLFAFALNLDYEINPKSMIYQ